MPSLPAAGALREALLSVLGKETRYSPDQSCMTRTIVTGVFKRFHVSTDGAGDPRNRGAARIRAMLNSTFRKQGLVVAPRWGHWALTDEGVSVARSINKFPYDPSTNITSQWLTERLGDGLYSTLTSSVAAKFRISVARNMVDDHVNTFLAKLIQRDSLRERLILGKPVYNSQLASWCCRSAQNDIRSMGTDPVSRTMYGAQTITERKRGSRSTYNSANTRQIAMYTVKGATVDESRTIEILDEGSSPASALESKQRLHQLYQQMKRSLRKTNTGNLTHLEVVGILDAMIEGSTVAEISHRFGLTLSRTHTVVGRMRRTLREARDNGLLAA